MATLSTRKSIRRRVGRLTGDMLLLTATANATTLTFTDALNLNHEQSILINRHGLFSGGTTNNLTRVVRITANTKATQTITFTPATPDITAIGDELELWNQRDEGLTPSFINDTINDVLADVYENAPVPVVSDSFTFDATAPIIAIDDLEVDEVADGLNWESITGVEWRLSGDSNVTYGWNKVDTPDLEVDQLARTITIGGRHQWLCDANSVRVRGANIVSTLGSDSATTQLASEFVAHQAAAMALQYRMEKAFDKKEVDIARATLQARADSLRPRTVLRIRGRYWRLV